MFSKPIRLILALTLIATGATAFAQSSTTSPYSKVGYGLLSDNASGIQRGMGGVGYAMQNGRVVNVMNPASYAAVDSLTFIWDIGLDLTNLWSQEDGKTGYNFGGGLDYITAQFRLAKGLGGSIGIIPYSSVGYSFGSDIDNGSEERSGSGGLIQLYAGAGYRLFKGLSVGANFSYLFGTTMNYSAVSKMSTSFFQRVMEVRDWNVNIGLQYVFAPRPNDKLVVGLSYQPKMSFHGHTWGLVYDSQDTEQDTVGYTSLKNKFERPHSFGAGVSYEFNRKFLAEVDLTYQKWKDAKYTPLVGFEDYGMKFDDRWKVAAGLQYTPNKRGSYVGAMCFRIGGYYNHDYINITGNNLRDYGASIGIGLPVPNGKTTINLGFEWKHRYTAPTSMIKEDYFNITLGVCVNEMWFWKSKIR